MSFNLASICFCIHSYTYGNVFSKLTIYVYKLIDREEERERDKKVLRDFFCDVDSNYLGILALSGFYF